MKPLDTADAEAMLANARRMIQQARTPDDLDRARRSESFWAARIRDPPGS